ncbi:hypothetical protein WRSd3_p00351 (plasmid) [Shigella dysenteriae WRSd3]|uniref:Uncharacterized protein n=1 Tax=Shigella dysenteriae WRSd3 TaxID=1401327 RepID=A0A090NA93_SHIDY|nr:hypothetical protein WRSd3_p00351 [Shigella dysenteriae WRSd3]ESU76848.1 hypothetical protein WRSd5_p00295 [Shigella dysenteriae WRSd5]
MLSSPLFEYRERRNDLKYLFMAELPFSGITADSFP